MSVGAYVHSLHQIMYAHYHPPNTPIWIDVNRSVDRWKTLILQSSIAAASHHTRDPFMREHPDIAAKFEDALHQLVEDMQVMDDRLHSVRGVDVVHESIFRLSEALNLARNDPREFAQSDFAQDWFGHLQSHVNEMLRMARDDVAMQREEFNDETPILSQAVAVDTTALRQLRQLRGTREFAIDVDSEDED